jgi:hypothetical protein
MTWHFIIVINKSKPENKKKFSSLPPLLLIPVLVVDKEWCPNGV